MGSIKRRIYAVAKRLGDVIFSLALLFLLALPMLLIAILIRLTSKGGAIFKQKRVGRGGRLFTCYKFRTMYIYAPPNRPTASFPDSQKYITPIGRLLRRSSLDELPQLLNVLIGDMSLVGPRPLIVDETELHRIRERCGVYSIRPGITGLAQIRGRDMLTDSDKARFDVRYVRNMSALQDMRILLTTLLRAANGSGVAR